MTEGRALEIITPSQSSDLTSELLNLSEDAFETRGSGFGGIDTSSVIFVTLSVPFIKKLGDVLVARIKAGQTIRLRYKGMTLEGVSEETILKALETVRHDLEP